MAEDGVRLVFDKAIPCEGVRCWDGVDWEKRPPRMLQDCSSGSLGPVTLPTGRQISQPWALMNERELENRLAAMGYRPINPECFGPEAQIELFGSAQRIVVLGGAGLFNAVFCKPGTKIVDIESTRDHLENHSTILSGMDADYGIALGQVDQSDPAPHNKRWTVDVERATAAIAEFMG